jgi:hypothetical protein
MMPAEEPEDQEEPPDFLLWLLASVSGLSWPRHSVLQQQRKCICHDVPLRAMLDTVS